jgi:hypothetical protein
MRYSLLAFFLILNVGCKEKVYRVQGVVDFDKIRCSDYPELNSFKSDLDKILELSATPSTDLTLDEITDFKNQLQSSVDRLKTYFKPEITALDHFVKYGWSVAKKNVPEGSDLKTVALVFNGLDLPLEVLSKTEDDRMIHYEVSFRSGILDICGLSRTLQALIEVRYGNGLKYYYRLMI